MDEVEELKLDLKIKGVEKLIRKLPNVKNLILLGTVSFCPMRLAEIADFMNNLQHLDVSNKKISFRWFS